MWWKSKIGLVTSPGPRTTQVGVGVGDTVTVGSGVSVHVAVSVAEAAAIRGRERGNFVTVGMSVARGVTTVPVQAVKKNSTPIKMFIFRIAAFKLEWVI